LADSIASSSVVGGPVDIWTIDKKDRQQLDAKEIKKNLEETYQWWPKVAEEYFKKEVAKKLNSFSVPQPPS
jgi:hypothetical protein